MKIRVLSDLHLEFAPFTPEQVQCDIVVLAGDTDLKLRGIRWAIDNFNDLGVPVLYVFGNHEFYSEKWPRLIEKGRALAAGTNVHILENDIFELNGWRFFGATLWSDYRVTGDEVRSTTTAADGMSDFYRIRHWPTLKRFSPRYAQQAHAETIERLRVFLSSGDRSRSVVVTHHAPSLRSQAEEFINDPLTGAYASNLEPLITDQGPSLWVHGHIHKQSDYVINNTRVIANPRGYPGEQGFKPKLIIGI